MAAKSERKQLHTEGKIPVFTVLKNGAILKNIFIVNKPPEEQLCVSSLKSVASIRDHEDILILGRHPDCNIMLTHPSISRFHLRIRSKPSSQKLSVVDLSSVHGTWVSERKLDPGVSVDLKEGDTLRIGGSSRVYRLHWIPISLAYDLENSFLSELDVAMEEETREEDAVPEEEKVEIVENEKFCSADDGKSQPPDSTQECINSLLPDENLELTVKKEILSAPPMMEEAISSTYDEQGNSPLKDDHQQRKTVEFLSGPFEAEILNLYTTSESENPSHLKMVVECDNAESLLSKPEKISDFSANLESQSCVEKEIEAYLEAEKPRETKIINSLKEHLTQSILPIVETVQGTKMQQFQDVIDVSPDNFTSQLSPLKQEAFLEKHQSSLTNLDPASFDEKSAVEMARETEFGYTRKNDDRVKDISTVEAGKLVTESTSLLVEEAILDTKFQRVEIVEEVTVFSLSDAEKHDKCCKEHKSDLQGNLSAKYCQERGHSVDEIVQDIDDRCKVGIYPVSSPAESVNSSLPDEAVFEIKNNKESQTLLSLNSVAGYSEINMLESRVEGTEKNFNFCNIWSGGGKAAGASQVRTLKSRVKGITSVDTEVKMGNQKNIVIETISKDFLSVLDGQGEIFTPDKENISPNTLQLQFLKKKGKLEEINHSKSHRSHNSEDNLSANIYPNESMSPTSSKENRTLKIAQEQKPERRLFCSHIKLEHGQDIMALNNRVKIVPFQSLLVNSIGKRRSETSGNVSAAKKSNADNSGQILDKQANPSHINGERKRSWDMVVDTASLLNKESRKALQLLQGLKGTHLIIPRPVIRELESMKLQLGVFRRTSEASLALEWIEECTVKTKWWIHVQSSTDKGKLIALTPPAPPQTQSEESWTFPSGISSSRPLSFQRKSAEIVSSTLKDNILDCALLYRTKQNNEQLVLLSDDVNLKVKSMAQGLLCETVQEFRESLVNPFSERFLWPNSSPRGQIWSCQDDVFLRDKYCSYPLKKSSKGEGARGLKLILLHNSQYGQISSDRSTF